MKLRINHLPEYPKDAALFGTFMISACTFMMCDFVSLCRAKGVFQGARVLDVDSRSLFCLN